MYAQKKFARRRPEGWADRRRYFRRLFEAARAESDPKPEPAPPDPSPRR